MRQQMRRSSIWYIEHLLYTRQCSRHWRFNSEQNRQGPCSYGVHIPEEKRDNKHLENYQRVLRALQRTKIKRYGD